MKSILPAGTPSSRYLQRNTVATTRTGLCTVNSTKLASKTSVRSFPFLPGTVGGVLLPLSAFVLWLLSLHAITLQSMTDLGLVSVLPAANIVALGLLLVSFCIALNQKKLSEWLLALHLLLLIFMLYGITTLVEQQPRFSIVYQHAGFTELIMRTGAVDPYFEAYFNWPGFFLLSAFLTQIAGLHDILSYATWAPVYFNLFYLPTTYVIFTTITVNKRIIWLSLGFFYLTNWIAQDYYSPQGLNFFLYLLILAILLKWFKKPLPATPQQQATMRRRLGRLWPRVGPLYMWLTAPDPHVTPVQPRQRRALLACVVIIFAFMVFSHPLTPFFTIATVTALVVTGRITPRWLPIYMCAATAGWAIVMAQPYLAGHLAPILKDAGQLGQAIHANATNRLTTGAPEHVFVCQMRAIMTFLIWGLACLGAILRLKQRYHDTSFILLAVVLFPIVFVQSYGGEMLMRIYLFTLPMMAFFAAALFYTPLTRSPLIRPKIALPTKTTLQARIPRRTLPQRPTSRTTLFVSTISIVLLAGFLFTRYGNERVDYVTNAELAGVRHLYSVAPKGSLLLAGWDETSWQFQDIEHYQYYVLNDDEALAHTLTTHNIVPIVQFINSSKSHAAYIILSRSQRALAQRDGLSSNALARFEHALLTSQKFALIYQNSDTHIYQFKGTPTR